MNAELTPGEQRMAERASGDAQAVANLLGAPVSGQNIHDAERHLGRVAAAVKYLRERVAPPHPNGGEGIRRPGHD